MIKDQTVGLFLDRLASQAPTPGGGGAAAAMGAMGAALVSMVCNLTLGKKHYAAVEAEMRTTLELAENLRARLTGMADADADAFNQVMGAYGLPKESDEQKLARAQSIQSALKAATEVPLACAMACAEVIALCRIVAEKGNKNIISDAGVAALAAYGGLQSAILNIQVNAAAIKDEAFVSARLAEIETLQADMAVAASEIHRLVLSRL
jgi:formiminotetrahydrofolate cyclodeaminase